MDSDVSHYWLGRRTEDPLQGRGNLPVANPLRGSSKGKTQREQYLLPVDLSRYRLYPNNNSTKNIKCTGMSESLDVKFAIFFSSTCVRLENSNVKYF